MILTKRINSKPLFIIKCIGFLMMIQYPISAYKVTWYTNQYHGEYHFMEEDGYFESVLLIFILGSICYFLNWIWSYLASVIIMWFNVQNSYNYRGYYDFCTSCMSDSYISEGEKLLDSALQAGELASKVAIATMLLAFLVGVIRFIKEVIKKRKIKPQDSAPVNPELEREEGGIL